MNDIVIETQNLSKQYGNLLAVNDLNLEIKKGEVFGFLGPNGSGKTTAINMMVGLLKPTNGKVIIGGNNAPDDVKGGIGVMPQEIVIWDNLTCMENLMVIGDMYDVPKDVIRERVHKLLTDLQLIDKKDALSHTLSGGMKRRLNLAMALIHEPDILVLDEPSPGLDPQSRRVLWNYIKTLSDGKKTIILTTHDMEEADRLSDRVAIIDHGKLLILDTPENLKNKIGKGDIVEIKLRDEGMNKKIVQEIASIDEIEESKEVGGKIYIRALNAVKNLSTIFNLITSSGGDIVDVKIRKNTLEDVFITLTGKELRE
ncbi:MAG: multidrug ABC transporter ATP-binding protein [Candidatus Altiarchaeales archaeon A3]|nr:MAG: multidrug ABC transporter ATP-binding protein [Candidatus Altiarchaeales archaeon A3]